MSANTGVAPPSIVVTALRGIATVQDLGRPGHMHEGVPPGGALVPELLVRANRAAGNDDGAAAIELFGGMTVIAGDAGAIVATSGGARVRVASGARLDVAPDPRVRVTYVAIAGGLDVPRVLGGRGTLLVAQLGGLGGRPLRRGDVLTALTSVANGGRFPEILPPLPDLDALIAVVRGPDIHRFEPSAFVTLMNAEYRIAIIGDRVGLRLDGPPLARCDSDDGLSAPMVRGAIEVPGAGAPIVLGPDHPTTGGYPVLAVVLSSAFGNLAARKPGAAVRFIEIIQVRLARTSRPPVAFLKLTKVGLRSITSPRAAGRPCRRRSNALVSPPSLPRSGSHRHERIAPRRCVRRAATASVASTRWGPWRRWHRWQRRRHAGARRRPAHVCLRRCRASSRRDVAS